MSALLLRRLTATSAVVLGACSIALGPFSLCEPRVTRPSIAHMSPSDDLSLTVESHSPINLV